MNFKKKIIQVIKILLPVGIGIFFIWYSYQQFSQQQLQEIQKYFIQADYRYLFLSLFLGLLSHLSRAYRWYFLLDVVGHKPKFYNSVMSIFVAYMMNLFIPRSGEVSRALVMNKFEDIPFEKSMGTIIAERLVDLFVLLCFVLFAFALQYDIISDYLSEVIDPSVFLKYVIALPFIALALVLIFRKNNFKLKRFSRMKKFMSGLKEGIFSLFKIKKRSAFILHTLFIWLMYLAMFYVGAFAIPETSFLSVGAAVTTFIIGGLAIAFTNGGLGSYPYLVAKMLLLYGILNTAGTAFGWIIWSAQFIMFIVMGLLSFVLLPIINKRKN